jgi:hypothetical protein
VLGLLREERNNFQENVQEPGKYLWDWINGCTLELYMREFSNTGFSHNVEFNTLEGPLWDSAFLG